MHFAYSSVISLPMCYSIVFSRHTSVTINIDQKKITEKLLPFFRFLLYLFLIMGFSPSRSGEAPPAAPASSGGAILYLILQGHEISRSPSKESKKVVFNPLCYSLPLLSAAIRQQDQVFLAVDLCHNIKFTQAGGQAFYQMRLGFLKQRILRAGYIP